MNIIEVENLVKDYSVARRDSNMFRYMFRRKYDLKRAVDNISFSVSKGELIGYIGPNGAGKSTTIKILTGILYPTDGQVSVLGNTPSKKRKENAARIGVVFGQRTQLWWDLPVLDSFLLLKKIYKIPEESFKHNLDELTELLDLASFMDRPVRQISLGQRMRADLAASLLHDPEVLFLDEPTIGLDVVAKYQIRRFIRKTQEEKRMTVILTTHDMKDIEEICDRIIMIDKGKLVMDMRVNDIRKKLNSTSKVTVTFERDQKQVDIPLTSVLSAEGQKWILSYNKHEISTPVMISKITDIAPISDISIEEPDIEDIIRDIYTGAITL